MYFRLFTTLLAFLCFNGLKADDFYTLMGLEMSQYSKLVTESDLEQIDQFKALYLQKGFKKAAGIPRKIHFIWIGPKKFPEESLKNVKSWIDNHPEYEVFFWTDRKRDLQLDHIIFRDIHGFAWNFLEKKFEESDNFGEKSDLLRYEILFSEGGIYVDHDVICYKPFDSFINSYDLFCGLEPLHVPLGDTSVEVCNNLIGSCPNHPVLKATIDLVQKNWEVYGKMYPGSDVATTTQRVYHRTYAAFDKAFKKQGFLNDRVNVAFPSGYFNKLNEEFGLFSHHFFASTWFESETKFERGVRKKLEKICRKNNQLIAIACGSCLISIILVCYLGISLRAIKKSMNQKY